MKNNSLYEIIVSVVLVALSVLLLNPWGFWMPSMVVVCMLAFLVGAFALLAVFVVRDKSLDERELHHSMLAGKTAFLVGIAVITLGIFVESLTHSVDMWLVFALLGMILAKFLVRFYNDRNY